MIRLSSPQQWHKKKRSSAIYIISHIFWPEKAVQIWILEFKIWLLIFTSLCLAVAYSFFLNIVCRQLGGYNSWRWRFPIPKACRLSYMVLSLEKRAKYIYVFYASYIRMFWNCERTVHKGWQFRANLYRHLQLRANLNLDVIFLKKFIIFIYNSRIPKYKKNFRFKKSWVWFLYNSIK